LGGRLPAYRLPLTPLQLPPFHYHILGRNPAAQHSAGGIDPEMVLHAADVQGQALDDSRCFPLRCRSFTNTSPHNAFPPRTAAF
jgi:hypothetical protein